MKLKVKSNKQIQIDTASEISIYENTITINLVCIKQLIIQSKTIQNGIEFNMYAIKSLYYTFRMR